jgi:hypothetical protein
MLEALSTFLNTVQGLAIVRESFVGLSLKPIAISQSNIAKE